jgi:uncharacterized membrane protein
MEPVLGIVGELVVVSIALGALFWALGYERPGKRAIVFGIVLGAVGEALAQSGTELFAWVRAHRAIIGLAVLGAVVLVALLRLAWSVQGGKGEAKLSKKRRVQGGP